MVSKKHALKEPNIRVPQTIGISGWIVLYYEKNIPMCVWVTSKETKPLQICIDERLCGDTIFSVEMISKTQYVIRDIFVYNSCCIFNVTTFKQRYEWSRQLCQKFIRSGLITLIHKSELPSDIKIKGYEEYDNKKGSIGHYIEDTQTILKTEIPDVYIVEGKEGYVLVPDLKTSKYLRSLGNEFKLACIEKDGNWLIKDIPEVK
jgi:hypothetical protein